MTIDELTEAIAFEISGWDAGHQIIASFVNDGNGHRDFMGFTVTNAGKVALRKIIDDYEASHQEVS